MFAENRFKTQNSQKVIGEKPPPKAEFPKGGWFLKRFSLKLFKNHIFSKNNFKKQNSQKGIGAKPPPKAEFLKGGWFLKRLSLKLFKNQKQNARKEDGCWRDLAWNYSKTTFLQKTALKSRILKRHWRKTASKSRIPKRRMVFEGILNLFQNNSKCVLEGFRSGMWFWKTIPESKAPTKGMCLFDEIQSKSPQKQLFLKGRIPKGMWFWKNHFWKHNSGMESCFVRALNPPQAKAMVFEEI